MEVRPHDPGVAAAAEITTLRQGWALFRRFGSPRAMAFGLVVVVAARAVVAVRHGFSWWDPVAVAVVVTLIPVVEWFVHLVVLHAKPFVIGGVTVDVGAGHRHHHLHPASIDWVLLRGVDAAVFQVMNAAVVVVVVGGPMWLLGADDYGAILTGVIAAICGLAHYEWCHFLFHIAYRPKSRYYRRLKSNHRLHHWRNERFWLGVTTNAGDRLLRTYPASRSAVPLSPTARTLGIEPPDPDSDG